MTIKRILTTTAFIAVITSPAFAQSVSTTTGVGVNGVGVNGNVGVSGANSNASSDTQRDVNQQNRIEQGLQSGQLNDKEASHLERGEARIDRTESRDLKDGSISASEQARLDAMQNKESKTIYNQKHDAQIGDPNSASSKRLETDVQRDANEEKRINTGVNNGSLKNGEVSKLERGQARDDRAEARVGANGTVNANEQARIQNRENNQSGHVYAKKHNGHVRGHAVKS